MSRFAARHSICRAGEAVGDQVAVAVEDREVHPPLTLRGLGTRFPTEGDVGDIVPVAVHREEHQAGDDDQPASEEPECRRVPEEVAPNIIRRGRILGPERGRR